MGRGTAARITVEGERRPSSAILLIVALMAMHVDSKPMFLRLGAGRMTRGRSKIYSTINIFDRLGRKLPSRKHSRQYLTEGRLRHWGHEDQIRCGGPLSVLSAKGGEESPSDECEAENPILQLQEAVNRVTNECPWALDQTPESIIEYLVSEVDEVQEHLDISPFTPDTSRSTRKEGDNKLEDELGDLLMNVLLLTSVAKSQASRDVSIQGAAKRAVEKLHRRCPYIFGAERVETIEEARAVWQRVKREEQQREEEEEVEREGAKSAKALE